MCNTSRIVLTTGVFDILHNGHIALFKTIKEMFPDYPLIVGVNGDRRASELKRMVCFSAIERAEIISSIKYVSAVVIFDEDDPSELIKTLKPKYFIKGSDYKNCEIPEAKACSDCGTEIVFIEHEYSEKIRSSFIKDAIWQKKKTSKR